MSETLPDLGFLAASSAELPTRAGTHVDLWYDRDERLVAFSHRDAARCSMVMLDVGLYTFSPNAGDVSVVPDPFAPREVVEDTFYRSVIPMVLQARGMEVLHASAVLGPEGVIALTGVSGTGKSTHAHALSRRGKSLWADDAVAIKVSARQDPVVLSIPFGLRLRPEPRLHFADSVGVVDATIPQKARKDSAKTVPLAAVVVLEQVEATLDDPVSLERLSGSESLRVLLTNGYCFSLGDRTRTSLMARQYLAIARSVPVLRCRFSAGLHNLERSVQAIERATAAIPAPAP